MTQSRLEQAIDFLRKDSPAEAEYYEDLKNEEEAFSAAQATLAEMEKWKKEPAKKDEPLIGRVHAHRVLCEKLAQKESDEDRFYHLFRLLRKAEATIQRFGLVVATRVKAALKAQREGKEEAEDENAEFNAYYNELFAEKMEGVTYDVSDVWKCYQDMLHNYAQAARKMAPALHRYIREHGQPFGFWPVMCPSLSFPNWEKAGLPCREIELPFYFFNDENVEKNGDLPPIHQMEDGTYQFHTKIRQQEYYKPEYSTSYDEEFAEMKRLDVRGEQLRADVAKLRKDSRKNLVWEWLKGVFLFLFTWIGIALTALFVVIVPVLIALLVGYFLCFKINDAAHIFWMVLGGAAALHLLVVLAISRSDLKECFDDFNEAKRVKQNAKGDLPMVRRELQNVEKKIAERDADAFRAAMERNREKYEKDCVLAQHWQRVFFEHVTEDWWIME